MSKDPEQASLEQDRRRYFRIDDEVGLKVRPIPASEKGQAIADFSDERSHASLMNELRALRDLHLPQRRSLEHKLPTVAAYMRMVEKQIDMLALAIGDTDDFSTIPDTAVDLSAQGLCFDSTAPLEPGSLVELKLTLFPDHCHIKALARVVRCDSDLSERTTALELTHLREADREAIIRHVHVLQRLRLQAHAEEQFDQHQ